MVMKRTNREKCNQVSSDAIRESYLFCFSPCSCYTSDVADWSDRFVARDAQSLFVGARDTSVCCVQGSSQFAFW